MAEAKQTCDFVVFAQQRLCDQPAQTLAAGLVLTKRDENI